MPAHTKYAKELAEEICNTIATTPKGIEKLCKENPHWPCNQTIMEWRIKRIDFAQMYDAAKKHQIDSLVNRAIALAQSPSEFYETADGMKPNPVALNRNRLEIDTIKWIACKLLPKVYGEKITTDVNMITQEEAIKELK